VKLYICKEMYKYTQTWFFGSEIRGLLSKFLDKSAENKILEIGCFEGLSSVFLSNFIDHPNSTLHCVDPFLTVANNDHNEFLKNGAEENFNYNMENCAKNRDKITIYKMTSDNFFETTKPPNQTYTFIYIDGCHEVEYIMRDMENSFRCLEKNGIMWMDDYCGGDGIKIRNTMNSFLEKYKGHYEIIHSGYQLAIRRTV